jgi:exopolysaccharide production protein ExoY
MNEQTFINPQIFRCNIKHVPIKRIFDVIFSTFALTIFLPVYLIIALAILLTSKGKVFFVQERIGRGGHTFKCLKFRTMYPDADKRLDTILQKDPTLKVEWLRQRKLKNDPRITPIGSFLRKTSLDELPQFWNVLKGDLSVVGPRPVVHDEIVNHYGMKAAKILSIRPGITGIWQVSGRSDTSYSTRIKLDEKYVDNHSISLDLKLIMRTIPKMINTKGAY